MADIDKKFLKGLKFCSSVAKEAKAGSKRQYVPTERPLTASDIIGYADNGDSVVFVSADGRKYVVSKKGDPDESEKKTDTDKDKKEK